jgi:hypothetical protein
MVCLGELRLLAIVWAAEQPSPLDDPAVEVSTQGELAAVLGRAWSNGDEIELALRHDDVVAQVQRACSAVVPFRLGTCIRDERELRAMLRVQRPRLVRMLERFGGRIEMGLKLRLGGSPPHHAPSGLDAIRSLTADIDDRDERLAIVDGRAVLSGRYLIDRDAVGRFWAAFDDMRTAAPDMAAMGSGPWAPYSFCESPSDCRTGAMSR